LINTVCGKYLHGNKYDFPSMQMVAGACSCFNSLVDPLEIYQVITWSHFTVENDKRLYSVIFTQGSMQHKLGY